MLMSKTYTFISVFLAKNQRLYISDREFDAREVEALLAAKSGLAFDGCQPPLSEQPRCFNKVWLSGKARRAKVQCSRLRDKPRK